VAVRVQVVFEGEAVEAIVGEVREWLAAQPAVIGSAGPADGQREREVRRVLEALKGQDSRRLVRDLAEAASRGEGLSLAELKVAYGKPNGTAFAGIVGGANKLMRRFGRRDLILRDAAIAGYRIDPLDATIVLVLRPDDKRPAPQAAGRRGGIAPSQGRRAQGAMPGGGR
jgi:hypothetical protein